MFTATNPISTSCWYLLRPPHYSYAVIITIHPHHPKYLLVVNTEEYSPSLPLLKIHTSNHHHPYPLSAKSYILTYHRFSLFYQHLPKISSTVFTYRQICSIAVPNSLPENYASAVTYLSVSLQCDAAVTLPTICTIIHNIYLPISA